MEKLWLVTDSATGAVLAQVVTGGAHPQDEGFAFDPETMTAEEVDRQGDPACERWDAVAGAWTMDADKVDAALHARIDAAAGAIRLRFITDIPGQMLIYERKEREARAFLAAEDPVLADYPLVAAEVAATGRSGAEAAATVVATAELWTAIAAAIEAARIGAKRAVSAAETREDKAAAATVDWDGVIAAAQAGNGT